MEMLKGQVAMVTGAGRGLGAEVSRMLGRAGVWVLCADIREDLAQGVVEEIRAADGYASALRVDVGRCEDVQLAVDNVVAQHGRLDILVNNAAIDVTLPADELAVDDWTRVIDTNLNGPYWCARACFPVMKKQGAGHIVNVASTAAKRTWPNASAYHASKWGLTGLSHALHVEGRPHGIKVTAVVAGGMRTPFLLDRFPDIDVSTLQDAKQVADTIQFVLTRPRETVIPEIMVLPMTETSWP